jgi:hypothetical protein
MPWPPLPPSRDEIAEEQREAYDSVVSRQGTDGPPGGYWGALLQWPEYAASLAWQGRLIRTAGDRDNTYSHADREWVDQVLSHDWGTNVVLEVHIPDALAAGVRLEAIEALRAGREDELTDDERFLTEFVRHVDRGTMTDEAWARMEERLGERGTVEYTLFIGHLIATMRRFQAFGLPDPPDSAIDAMLADFREGRRELPDFRERIR